MNPQIAKTKSCIDSYIHVSNTWQELIKDIQIIIERWAGKNHFNTCVETEVIERERLQYNEYWYELCYVNIFIKDKEAFIEDLPKLTKHHMDVIMKPTFVDNCYDVREISDFFGFKEYFLIRPKESEKEYPDHSKEILSALEIAVQNYNITIPTFSKGNYSEIPDYKGYLSHDILNLHMTSESFKNSGEGSLDINEMFGKLYEQEFYNKGTKFPLATSRIGHIINKDISKKEDFSDTYNSIEKMTIYAIVNDHMKKEFDDYKKYIQNADRFMINYTSYSWQVENAKKTIMNLIKSFEHLNTHGKFTAGKINTMKKHTEIDFSKFNNKSANPNWMDNDLLKVFDSLLVCPQDSYYSSIMNWAAEHTEPRSLAEAWGKFVEEATSEKFYNKVVKPNVDDKQSYNGQIYNHLLSINDLWTKIYNSTKEEKKEVHLVAIEDFPNKYKELNGYPISLFITDIIRHLLYCLIAEILDKMSLKRLLEAPLFSETIKSHLEKIENSLSSIIEENRYDNYDYTEIIMCLLNASSMYRIFSCIPDTMEIIIKLASDHCYQTNNKTYKKTIYYPLINDNELDTVRRPNKYEYLAKATNMSGLEKTGERVCLTQENDVLTLMKTQYEWTI